MVLAGDLHLSARAAGMIQSAMAEAELEGAPPQGQAQDLMAQTNTKQRQVGEIQQRSGQVDATVDRGGVTWAGR